ncbi:MSMEG_0567/Sll0786 family nitrogen starvation N-acetyltransferase [Candidatus Methylobacter oryzae]|uniref:GNAT family N-acetyltransferase n=1 Tax=Candidatus Methylobacter oryzae TaxID=2497749 RepID=A0ABY3C8X0_9GAMM|nr:MSMEG_0567/Sll0786 family nitrogen starvation N-acetyltransferase [Candidatus Methylobacter oryzae]TRW93105.1 GNAT family N-acetyltransferase [Candidatus Methylobacter oryzae]
MLNEAINRFMPNEYLVKWVTQDWEREQMLRLRQAVFCEEQGVFEDNDIDDIDQIATPIVALACVGGLPDEVVGTVRIHQSEPGVWWGSRLAVAADYRKLGNLGAALIRLAVTSAHAQGCHTFLAQVQSRNVPLFRRLHWRSLQEIELHGRPHHLMQADLAWYPPYADGETGFIATGRVAA